MYPNAVILLSLATFFGCSDFIGRNRALNPRKEPAYKTVQFNPKWYLNLNKSNHDQDRQKRLETTLTDSFFKSEEFQLKKNVFRAESYARATLSGVKNHHRREQREGIQFGFEALFAKSAEEKSGKRIVCYYNVPSVYDAPYPVFPEQIDPFMCTHILLAFARVVNLTLVPSDPRDVEFYRRTTGLKYRNPNLKVMISVGSMNDGSKNGEEFVKMMSSKENRDWFINQSIGFLETYGFDGIDIDWEFPAYGGPMVEKSQLTDLLKEFRGHPNKSRDFLLSAAVPAPKQIIDLGFDIQGISEVVDFVNLMSYDYHYYSTFSPVTGPNSPLHNLTSELGFFATLNLAWSAKYWYQNGMPASKINIGIPLYGHTFTLIDDRYHNYYSFAGGFGSVGQSGFASYVLICKFIESGAQVVFNEETREPYAYRVKEWISFDNQRSVKEKAKFIKEMGFGGAMIYSMNLDDAWKSCKSSKSTFPLIRTVKKELDAES